MTKEDLQKKLEELGEKIDKRWSEERLKQVLKETMAVHDLQGKNKMTVDEMVSGGKHDEDGYKRSSGIIIPKEVLVKLKKTEYTFYCTCLSDKCVIERADSRGIKTFFREFTKEIHGENFAEVAGTFMKSQETKK